MVGIHLGVVVASWIAFWGYRRGFLTGAGAIVAWLVGSCVWIGGRWDLAAPLVFFFVVSSVVTKWAARRSWPTGDRGGPATGRIARDGWQVGANGAVASVCALVALISGEDRWLYASLCAIAAMTGDTWSSEMGRALVRRPWDLRTRKRVEAGISGAVSLKGSLAGLAGVGLTTALGVILLPEGGHSAGFYFLVVGVWAYAVGWVDSVLGATLQLRYSCLSCGALTDNPRHCGGETTRVAGMTGIDNNVVNVLATIFAALVVFFLP